MRPPPFVPSARKTRRFAKLSPPEPGAGFANGAFCKVRPLRPPLRRPQHDAGFIWPVRYQSGGCFIAISCFIWSVRYQSGGCFIVLGADTPPHTPKQSCSMGAEKVKGSGAKRPAASGALDFLGYPMQYPA